MIYHRAMPLDHSLYVDQIGPGTALLEAPLGYPGIYKCERVETSCPAPD